jgi:hypothetical protein
MRGAFAEWQPRYAEHGIPTFPVKDKVPCVRGWQHVGLPASQLALKFPEADVFGFQCGRSSRITIVDIDSKDERIVNEAVKIFGDSPVLWRTGSGNFAMPFRHNGEGRRIRPIANLPIDVLGAGYAVAPPSAGKRQQYEFLKGGLDQFSSLPSLQLPANENSVPKGKRDNWLFKRLLREVRACDDFDTLLDVARTLNAECNPPMSDVQVISKAKQAWKYETAGNNWVGKRLGPQPRATKSFPLVTSLPPAACSIFCGCHTQCRESPSPSTKSKRPGCCDGSGIPFVPLSDHSKPLDALSKSITARVKATPIDTPLYGTVVDWHPQYNKTPLSPYLGG